MFPVGAVYDRPRYPNEFGAVIDRPYNRDTVYTDSGTDEKKKVSESFRVKSKALMLSKSLVSFLCIAQLAAFAAFLVNCSSSPASDDLPPLSYMCPMLKDSDVLEDHSGKSPNCGMELKPVRVVKA